MTPGKLKDAGCRPEIYENAKVLEVLNRISLPAGANVQIEPFDLGYQAGFKVTFRINGKGEIL